MDETRQIESSPVADDREVAQVSARVAANTLTIEMEDGRAISVATAQRLSLRQGEGLRPTRVSL
jgi:hypothetical protein